MNKNIVVNLEDYQEMVREAKEAYELRYRVRQLKRQLLNQEVEIAKLKEKLDSFIEDFNDLQVTSIIIAKELYPKEVPND